MSAMTNQEMEKDLQLISQKLLFLVKICKEADSDTENRFCVELVGRELSAYAHDVDQMASGLKGFSGGAGPSSGRPMPPRPAPAKPPSAPPLTGAKPLTPEPGRKPAAASPLDFPIDD